MGQTFLEGYGDQSIQELLAMERTHRIDSLVLAVEQALQHKPEAALTEPERVVLAVEALEREVNNGGYAQFFDNSSREHAGFIVRALSSIDCPKVAAITKAAVQAAGGKTSLDDAARDALAELDSRYFDNDEPIADRLFAYLRRHAGEIRIPHRA